VTWAPDYVDSSELKSYIGKIEDSLEDAFFALWITTVSRNVDDFTGRQFGQVASAEDRFYPTFYDRHERAWFAELDDLQDTTGLTLADEKGTAVPVQSTTVDGYTLLPRNAAVKGMPYERVKMLGWSGGELTAHAPWGWTAVPSAVKVGIFLQGARLKARKSSAFGVAGSPEQGNELRLLAQLDPDFRTSLKPLVRNWWAA
jgi:hypothetical protein